MAKLDKNHPFPIKGTFGSLSFYKMRGIDETIARTKGGADRKTIMKSPKFELTRLHIDEFSMAAQMGSLIRMTLWPVKHLADHNITPKLNAMCKLLMKQDTDRRLGVRGT